MAKVSEAGMIAGLMMSQQASFGKEVAGSDDGFSVIMERSAKAEADAQNDLMNLAVKSESQAPAKSADQVEDTKPDNSKNNDTSAKSDEATEVKKDPEQTKAKPGKEDNSRVDSKEAAADVKETGTANADAEEIPAEVVDAAAQIIIDLSSLLGISEEDLAGILDELELTPADLTVNGNVAQVVAAAMDVSTADIVMSEDLTDLVKDLASLAGEDIKNVAKELGVSEQELTKMVADAYSADEQAVMQQVSAQDVPDTEQLQAAAPETVTKAQDKTEAEPEMKVQVLNTTAVPVKEAEADETKADDPQKADAQPEVVNTRETENEENSAGAESTFDKNEGSSKKEQSGPAIKDTPVQPTAQVPADQSAQAIQQAEAARAEEQAAPVRAQQIIEQIAEHAKANGGEKLSSIEMMLNPANLGSIKLQLESDNGVIKGMLTASDDAVRAALESQLAQLRDALVQQGVKVEAIEVTVAGHELEQNLDQSGKQQEQEAEAAASKKPVRRNLDLNELTGEEELEEMTDAQRLEVEMMRMGGNRLNFQA